MDIWIISTILLITLYLLITEKISVDLTAIGIMVLLVISRILTPKEAISGFANPALITVGAMFVVSKGMMRTGGVEFLGRKIIQMAKGNHKLALIIILVSVAVASAFINNTPVVILFIPVVMSMCCEFGLSPSKFLIPVSYASILAGTCTLIGTSTNIIISDLSVTNGYAGLTMFELSTLGVPIAVIGIILLYFIAPKVLPDLANPTCQLKDGDHRKYLAELKIPEKSNLIGKNPDELFAAGYPSINVIELINKSNIYHPVRDKRMTCEDDILLVKGSLNDLVAILRNEQVDLPTSEKDLVLGAQKDAPIVVELIVSPHSSLRGQKIQHTDLARDSEIHIIALKRSNLHISEKQIHDVRLQTGDILLVWCHESKLESIRSDTQYIVIEDVYEELLHKKKAAWSILNFIGMVGTATLGLADIMTCALTAAFLMIITGCLQMRDAYRALQGDVLLLIAGTIALGVGMQKTGASQFYAETFISLFAGSSPLIVLGAIILLTSICTQILSNNATAVLLLPIAISTALGIGVDPKPFIVGICFGASACFATPVGYQTNLMVYGPGGYRFMDYMKLGLPLNAFVVITSTLFIPYIWPF
ncbi:SLC13 family permease [Desulforhopalus sp. IMCC35007]|uniref:SLC13 family permease n=1 Tax=Desulforhopalus sp. IMCC35007 TaxID=2569543 RepID=UPI0010AE3986|nr:SLC13 family permease [Desulforhopalus sp. IMCC35007]TKB11682.1 SLC13 family permease [Desulforhopalus sp. IMCC35007]